MARAADTSSPPLVRPDVLTAVNCERRAAQAALPADRAALRWMARVYLFKALGLPRPKRPTVVRLLPAAVVDLAMYRARP